MSESKQATDAVAVEPAAAEVLGDGQLDAVAGAGIGGDLLDAFGRFAEAAVLMHVPDRR